MPRTLISLFATMALLFGLAGPTNAATVTVASNGSPDLSKMVVNNAQGAVTVKLHGRGGKNVVRWSLVKLKGTDGVVYEAKVGWYSDRWIASLYRGQTKVTCGDFNYTWNATNKFWRVYVPRTCLGQLTNRIRAYAEHVTNVSATPGEAGWSPLVSRG